MRSSTRRWSCRPSPARPGRPDRSRRWVGRGHLHRYNHPNNLPQTTLLLAKTTLGETFAPNVCRQVAKDVALLAAKLERVAKTVEEMMGLMRAVYEKG